MYQKALCKIQHEFHRKQNKQNKCGIDKYKEMNCLRKNYLNSIMKFPYLCLNVKEKSISLTKEKRKKQG